MRKLALGISLVFLLGSPVPAKADAFQHPRYVATDSMGNIYVTESERHRVQKFDPNGTFLVQWGTFGAGDGQFDTPMGIAVDAANNVYVADYRNSRIEKFTSNGVFLTKWSVGFPTAANPRRPIAVAVDVPGDVYVTMTVIPRVQVFSGTGAPLRAWGDVTGNGDGEFAQSNQPGGISVGKLGYLYVSDTGNHRVQRFSTNGVFSGWTGRCTGGTNCDTVNQRSTGFFACTAATCSVTPATASGSGPGQFVLPIGIGMGGGNIYVVDSSNYRVHVYDTTTGFVRTFGSYGSAVGQLRTSTGAAYDPVRNEVIVADTNNNRLQRFDAMGAVTGIWGPNVTMSASLGETPGTANPITIDPSSTAQSVITVGSLNQFGGPVTLTAGCCIDYVTGVGPAPTGVTVSLTNNSINVPVNGSATTTLNITTAAVPTSGKYIATVNASNAALGINRNDYVVFTVRPVAGATFSVKVSPPAAMAPLPDLTPPGAAIYTVAVTSSTRYAGAIELSSSCCLDILTQKNAPVPGIALSQSAYRIYMTGSGTTAAPETQTATITVTTTGAPVWGKFLFPVTGTSLTAGSTQTTSATFSEFMTTDPQPPCRPAAELLPVGPLIKTLVKVKEQDPTKAAKIGIATVKTFNAIRWTLEDDATLMPNEAMIVLDNQTSDEKEITTSGCSTAPQTIRVKGGQTDMMKITPASTTLIFRRPFCTWGCFGHTWGDAGVFSEPALWRLIGGRKSTFSWLQAR